MSIPFFNMPLNFANVCRLCMQEKSTLLSLFIDTEVSDQVTPLRCKIMSLAPGVKVDAYDGLPTHVCRQCVNQVNVSYNFKRQCEISDAAFRELLRNHRSGSQSSEEKQNESQNSLNPAEDPPDVWTYVKVKAELAECQSDENSPEGGMEQE
jgi:hypothetical protein